MLNMHVQAPKIAHLQPYCEGSRCVRTKLHYPLRLYRIDLSTPSPSLTGFPLSTTIIFNSRISPYQFIKWIMTFALNGH